MLLFNRLNPFDLSSPITHFYSPIPSKNDIEIGLMMSKNNENQFLGIDFNEGHQKSFFNSLTKHYDLFDFPLFKKDKYLYFSQNDMYGLSSGILLFSIMLELRPKRIIEIGSGFSSALMMDTSAHFLDGKVKLTFIEPFPDRLKMLMSNSNIENVEIIKKRIQDVETKVFSDLEDGDILFIDGSHISKIGSDVNKIFFEILPRLKKGVLIHIHDIFFPFEYPESFLRKGIYWNELYILRAFLQYNDTFEIEFFNTFFFNQNPDLSIAYPKFTKDLGGCFWMSKKK